MTLTFTTLGPDGTCHQNAVAHYLDFQGVAGSSRIDLTPDFDEGLERLRRGECDFLVQCSAHPQVHLITERYVGEIHVVDTFVYPTKDLVLLSRSDVAHPRTLGLVPATAGYVDLSRWEEVVHEPSKPVVGRRLLEGAYDSGLTHLEWLERSDGALRLDRHIGAVTTTWVVYGRRARFGKDVIGTRCREYLLGAES
ncbi:hypothetical protein ACFC1R_04585 [Kitasatospora sp. NPDC056138]|uniref:hypothetical protein n=1 Tax=Kitasatospora sp. NPDC056138 TaxID=3345724 RepID=UPI0035DBE627